MDNAARTRQRVLAIFLPVTAVLYISAEALSPRGTDQVISTTATALKVLPIAARHPAQLYLAGSLALLGLGGLAVSYAAIAALGSSPARHSARSSRTTAHLPPQPDRNQGGHLRWHASTPPPARPPGWQPGGRASPASARAGAGRPGHVPARRPDYRSARDRDRDLLSARLRTALTGGTP